MIDTNELRKALLKHQPQTDPSAIELTRFMATIADELDLLSGLLKAEQDDCEKQRSGHNDMIRRVMKLETENERLNKALSEGIPILEEAADRIEKLEATIIKTLNENGHLADGENCTLIDLKRAMPTWELE